MNRDRLASIIEQGREALVLREDVAVENEIDIFAAAENEAAEQLVVAALGGGDVASTTLLDLYNEAASAEAMTADDFSHQLHGLSRAAKDGCAS